MGLCVPVYAGVCIWMLKVHIPDVHHHSDLSHVSDRRSQVLYELILLLYKRRPALALK
jgi:hypothetical protein